MSGACRLRKRPGRWTGEGLPEERRAGEWYICRCRYYRTSDLWAYQWFRNHIHGGCRCDRRWKACRKSLLWGKTCGSGWGISKGACLYNIWRGDFAACQTVWGVQSAGACKQTESITSKTAGITVTDRYGEQFRSCNMGKWYSVGFGNGGLACRSTGWVNGHRGNRKGYLYIWDCRWNHDESCSRGWWNRWDPVCIYMCILWLECISLFPHALHAVWYVFVWSENYSAAENRGRCCGGAGYKRGGGRCVSCKTWIWRFHMLWNRYWSKTRCKWRCRIYESEYVERLCVLL